MEIEFLKSGTPPSRDNNSFNSSGFSFDLPSLIENMKHSHSWAKGELNSMILLKSPEKQIVLTTLHEGTEITSMQSQDSITLQIIEGNIKFHTRKESGTLEKGQILILREKVKYSLKSIEETVLLLTVANDSLQHFEN